ncbi:23S rRNA (adenine(1618)-N(6))-methyltransferase RlmF [Flavobacterium sp. PLA-1-15]|uniref:23S rRNA (adenine(1618)-N(6))-methyltransferase RlmF n=1 Tax=Flavobacterium sp. PLA-1-15 TaxID=3380533 RepID=UPI003B7D89C4
MKPTITNEKKALHPRNPHRFRYDFATLIKASPALKPFVFINEFDIESIDFSNPEAVKALNNAILISEYSIQNWDIPKNYLCPPIPGRADYIHYLADLLAENNNEVIPQGDTVFGLDIGVGANCIYPIIGHSAYGWSFVATDIDEKAIDNCAMIIDHNPSLQEAISLQQQLNSRYIFKDIIQPEDRFAFTLCNPPFHSSEEEANKGTIRKINNLQNTKTTKPVLNFGGQNAELWCEGGELGFITQMAYESAKYPMQVLWFTTLVSKNSHLASIYRTLAKVNVATIKTIEMAQGQKMSRIVAWTFQSEKQLKSWKF